MHTCARGEEMEEKRHCRDSCRTKKRKGGECEVSAWDRNRSSGFSDRPNQCKQLDIAGNISFLRAARRSTAKRAQTTTTTTTTTMTTTTTTGVGRWLGCCKEHRRKGGRPCGQEGGKEKRKRIPVLGESLSCLRIRRPFPSAGLRSRIHQLWPTA